MRNLTSIIYSIPGQVQFLDRHHLLIKFGSVDGGVSSLCSVFICLFVLMITFTDPKHIK